MKRFLSSLLITFLAIFCNVTFVAAGPAISEQQIKSYIKALKINLGNQLKSNRRFIGIKDLKDLDKVAGYKIMTHDTGSEDLLSFTVNIKDASTPPEIGIFRLPSQELARTYAVHLFLLLEDGRAPNAKNITVTQGPIGDLSLAPKKILNDPHGIDMVDSDKTFIVFTRNNVTVYIDSKYSYKPKINVTRIANYIDAVLNSRD